MKKKILPLALALALCLGLTIPAFAAGTWRDGDITITVRLEGSIGYVSYTGSGELYSGHAYRALEMFPEIADTAEVHNIKSISISIGQGLTIPDDGFTYGWDTIAAGEGVSVTFNNSTTPAQPEQPQQPVEPASPAVDGWAKDRVGVAVSNNLVPDGLGDDYRVNITRGQFAAVAVKLYEAMSGQAAPAAGGNPFSDTSDPVILQAAELGFISGLGDGKFGPDSLVTREQMAVMLSQVYIKLGGEIPTVEATTFADNSAVSSWARNAVAFMSGKEIVTGVGNNNFSPKGSAKIEEALLVSLKMFEVLK